jgi:SAM-dependent methyltransferase
MTKEYWDKKHTGNFDGDWAIKPSMFAEYVVNFFPKKGRILEIGTGKGGDAGFFYSLGYEVVATDFSEEALKIARENFKNVEFVNVDTAKGLPFENNSFDVIYSHMSLHYFDTQTTRNIFENIHRLLKPKGIFATIANTMDDTEMKSHDFQELEDDFYKNTSKNILKRYFSTKSMADFAKGLFDPLILDNEGKVAYKNSLKTLVRFVGKKIN